MSSTTTTTQTVAPQPVTGKAQPVITPEALESLQVEADYEAHLEDRMGHYGY